MGIQICLSTKWDYLGFWPSPKTKRLCNYQDKVWLNLKVQRVGIKFVIFLSQLSISCSLWVWGFLFSLSPAEMLVASNTALNSPSDSFLHLQDASTEFKIANITTQQLGPGAQVRL